MLDIKKIEITSNPQSFFDCFNSFIMSNDKRVFNKLIARTNIYNEVKDVPGDIVECGVFKGSGIYTFLKLKNIFKFRLYCKKYKPNLTFQSYLCMAFSFFFATFEVLTT